jgi:hypothetical protein
MADEWHYQSASGGRPRRVTRPGDSLAPPGLTVRLGVTVVDVRRAG